MTALGALYEDHQENLTKEPTGNMEINRINQNRKIGDREVTFPEYMSVLPQQAIDILLDTKDSNERIVSCGIDPADGSLVMVTCSVEVMKIIPNKKRPIRCFPSHDGKRIGVMFNQFDIHAIDSKLALDKSENCVGSSSLFVNNTYMCDIDLSHRKPNENKVEGS